MYKRDEALIHAILWLAFENTVLKEEATHHSPYLTRFSLNAMSRANLQKQILNSW